MLVVLVLVVIKQVAALTALLLYTSWPIPELLSFHLRLSIILRVRWLRAIFVLIVPGIALAMAVVTLAMAIAVALQLDGVKASIEPVTSGLSICAFICN